MGPFPLMAAVQGYPATVLARTQRSALGRTLPAPLPSFRRLLPASTASSNSASDKPEGVVCGLSHSPRRQVSRSLFPLRYDIEWRSCSEDVSSVLFHIVIREYATLACERCVASVCLCVRGSSGLLSCVKVMTTRKK